MFADGAKGAAMQVHELFELVNGLEVPLDITLVWSRSDGADPGVRSFAVNGQAVDTFKEALELSDAARGAGRAP
ncbi:hypothetical protein M2322_002828 [Rhodoblastus acidophilus]|uniref:hypothetical protein n=1 Tax=Rhodoblastus acidophilus TaxID=1074 RepID=UPI002224B8AD|nr:hypothetical protein [Rhodoblastus acidophilus]MCW2317269.1 hypothetical protein [Rhodoblastus acidophilus]